MGRLQLDINPMSVCYLHNFFIIYEWGCHKCSYHFLDFKPNDFCQFIFALSLSLFHSIKAHWKLIKDLSLTIALRWISFYTSMQWFAGSHSDQVEKKRVFCSYSWPVDRATLIRTQWKWPNDGIENKSKQKP